MSQVYGYSVSPYDIRDYKVEVLPSLPPRFSLDFSQVKVKNQNQTSSCMAHALSTVLEYHAKNTVRLSTEFIYGLRDEFSNYKGKGMYMRDACKIAFKYGDLLYEDCPGNTEVPNCFNTAKQALSNSSAVARAAQYKIKAYYKCSTVDEIKTALIKYGPVIIGMNWYDDYRVKNGILVGGKSSNYGCHAIVIYGYDDRGFMCQNSFGKYWGEGGRFILPFDVKPLEARAIVDLENPIVVPTKKNKGLGRYGAKVINAFVNFVKKMRVSVNW